MTSELTRCGGNHLYEPIQLNRGMKQSTIGEIDPLVDPRWEEFVEGHPASSVFQTVGWLKALHRTYQYQPVVYTTSGSTEPLQNALVCCIVQSWLTGRRVVSLPFSDYCEPLCDSAKGMDFLVRFLQRSLGHEQWKYIELRPLNGCFRDTCEEAGFGPGQKYFLHRVDLRPSLDAIFRSFDKDSVQRRIRRAERAGVTETCGRSQKLLGEFYGLLLQTRRRHHLPPQPYVWFQNLLDCMGDAATIRVAYKENRPIASIFTLCHKDVDYYKYGTSDASSNYLGATPLLFWRAIQDAKSRGASKFDLGRTEEENQGLITFKNHWAARPQQLVYWTFPPRSLTSNADWNLRMVKRICAYLPQRVLTAAGELFYRHIG